VRPEKLGKFIIYIYMYIMYGCGSKSSVSHIAKAVLFTHSSGFISQATFTTLSPKFMDEREL
jgi:hypothetical protein